MKLQNIILCGLDRLGKTTLSTEIQHFLGPMTTIHSSKPLALNCYSQLSRKDALRTYSTDSISDMFQLLAGNVPLILDRAHLDEVVYAERYRGYKGDYIFELEHRHQAAIKKTLLVLLVTDSELDTNLKDDGLSHDWSKRNEEQEDFIRAFNNSTFPHKLQLSVGINGVFRDKAMLAEIISSQM